MIQAIVSRVRHSSRHPLLLSLFAAVFAVSDPARSSLLLGMLGSDDFLARIKGKLLRRA